MEIKVINHRPGQGYFIVDPNNSDGYMTVMSYLHQRQSNDDFPMFLLTKENDQQWFQVYLDDFNRLWTSARAWNPNDSDMK